MPTPSEQKALAFLALVVLLGGAVRVLRAGEGGEDPSADEVQGLARQVAAAESAGARQKEHRGRNRRAMPRGRRDGGADSAPGVASEPRGHSRSGGSTTNDGWVNGFPPPSPRIDVDNRLASGSTGSEGAPRSVQRGGALDVDAATAAELEALPGIGPALARRIVANRDSFGPFNSVEGLGRVRGIGPAGIRRLAGRVTFSGRAASFSPRSRED